MSGIPIESASSARAALPKPTTAVIADALREAITRGEIPAGAPLRQDRIAAQFGVSHIPVREALKQLVAEGLAVLFHNRGVVVSELSPEVAWELTEYRCLLEGQMMRWAVPKLTVEDLRQAEAILRELDTTADVVGTLDLNARFHSILYRRADRPFFMKSIQHARANLGRYWRLAWEDLGHKPRSQDEHRRIVELCRHGEAEEAGRAVEAHIRETGTLIVDYLRCRAEACERARPKKR